MYDWDSIKGKINVTSCHQLVHYVACIPWKRQLKVGKKDHFAAIFEVIETFMINDFYLCK